MKRITRRQALLTGGGLAATGVAAALYLGPRRIVDRVTRDCGPDAPPVADAGWSLEPGTLRSEFVETPVSYILACPPGTTGGPLVVCLPGRGGRPEAIIEGYALPDRVAAAVGPAFSLLAVDGGESYWHRRANGEDRLAMLLLELLPSLRGRFGAAPRALWGWSMGGYGALRVAAERPGAFVGVATGGAALWRTAAETAPGAFDDPDDFSRNDVFSRLGQLQLPAFIACGTSDPFLAANKAFAAAHRTETTTDFSQGCHGAPYWTRVAEAQAVFLRDAIRAA